MSDSLKILVAEDDDALRDALLITLEAAGHRATGADGGPAALAALARERKRSLPPAAPTEVTHDLVEGDSIHGDSARHGVSGSRVF